MEEILGPGAKPGPHWSGGFPPTVVVDLQRCQSFVRACGVRDVLMSLVAGKKEVEGLRRKPNLTYIGLPKRAVVLEKYIENIDPIKYCKSLLAGRFSCPPKTSPVANAQPGRCLNFFPKKTNQVIWRGPDVFVFHPSINAEVS